MYFQKIELECNTVVTNGKQKERKNVETGMIYRVGLKNIPMLDSMENIAGNYDKGSVEELKIDEIFRNPDGDRKGPWCFTLGGSWDHCRIKKCPHTRK